MRIIKAALEHVNIAATLFNAYRIFYEKPSDLEGAKAFLYERTRNKESAIFLCFDDSKSDAPVGFMQLYPSFSSVGMQKIFVLNDLYVDEIFRHKGVGHQLMKAANEFAIANGAAKLTLETSITNEIGRKLYISEGYLPNHHYVTMELELPLQKSSILESAVLGK